MWPQSEWPAATDNSFRQENVAASRNPVGTVGARPAIEIASNAAANIALPSREPEPLPRLPEVTLITPVAEFVGLSTLGVGLTAAPMAPPAVPSATVPTETTSTILEILRRYADALNRMDLDGAAEVWPTVNTRALAEAFQTISSERINFDACAVDTPTRSTATASCHGTLTFVPKIGSRAPRRTRQQWLFTLNKDAGSWTIERGTVAEVP